MGNRNVNIYDPVHLDPLILQFQYGYCPKKQSWLYYGPYTPLFMPIHLQTPNLAQMQLRAYWNDLVS